MTSCLLLLEQLSTDSDLQAVLRRLKAPSWRRCVRCWRDGKQRGSWVLHEAHMSSPASGYVHLYLAWKLDSDEYAYPVLSERLAFFSNFTKMFYFLIWLELSEAYYIVYPTLSCLLWRLSGTRGVEALLTFIFILYMNKICYWKLSTVKWDLNSLHIII